MFAKPERQEIDHHTIKLIVGIIALSLGSLTSFFTGSTITSISASYYYGGWAQSIFVGFLFAIAAFLLSYNGATTTESILSKVAALAALGVALFPCECEGHTPPVRLVHGASAAIMFLVLVFFCYSFYRRAKAKGHPQARARAAIYAGCGIAIILCIAVLGLNYLLGGELGAYVSRLTYRGERTALVAFAISWLTASRSIPVITTPRERLSPLR